MRDPFPIPPPEWLVRLVKPTADSLKLHSLPLHIHEVIFAAFLYTFISSVVSPWLSALVCPNHYPKLSARSRLSWDVHVVSFVQSVLISVMSLWIILYDEERASWRSTEEWPMRVWAYDGAGGLCQSFALGYFLWDLYMCSRYVEIFGWGMLAHAVSAVAVFSLGYRPFIYFSAPVFLLYELSSPFLNIHWFCDKLDLTGSIYQAVNGVFLTSTFFGCRIVWGIWSSILVFRDMYWAVAPGATARFTSSSFGVPSVERLMSIYSDTDGQVSAFNADNKLPLWLPAIYLASNVVLNTLNLFWFGKMIETIRTRFDPPLGTRGTGADADISYEPITADVPDGQVKDQSDGKKEGSVRAARLRAEEALDRPIEDVTMQRAVYADGHKGLEINDSARRSVRSRRKA